MSKKVLHIPYCFYPDPVAGTEIYVETLCQELKKYGFDSVIAAPGEVNSRYTHNTLEVRRFATDRTKNVQRQYAMIDEVATANFCQILDSERPDIVHLHAFTSAASISIVEASQSRGTPVVFSYHTPTVTCARGTLLRWGNELCEGYMDDKVCTQCNLNANGLSKQQSYLVGYTPPIIGKLLDEMGLSGGVWTALRMRELVRLRLNAARNLFSSVNTVIVMADWVKNLLHQNGVSGEKIRLIRHGIPAWNIAEIDEKTSPEDTLKIIYIGRVERIKGIHLLLDAIKKLQDLSIQLDVYGIIQSDVGDYSMQIQEAVQQDDRVSVFDPVPHSDVIPLLKQYHMLAVPSQWLETGPLVVLEAFAAGIPVIGSNLGGIAEWVQSEVNGLLVQYDDVEAWASNLSRLVSERGLWDKLRSGISPPPTMTHVARSMADVYTDVITKSVNE